MSNKPAPIPEGYHTVTPYLIIDGASAALDYYAKAFGAKELLRMPMPGGLVGHAEIQIGDSRIMLADQCPDMEFRGPLAYGGTPVSVLLYVEDVDTVFAQALAAGGEVVKPLKNEFYGDRSGTLRDPFGHVWSVATHVEDVTMEEMEKRMETMFKPE